MTVPASDQYPFRGIALIIISMFAFATMDGVSKFLVHRDYAIAQLFLVRYLVFILFALWVCRKRGVRSHLASKRPFLQIARAGILLGEGMLFVISFRYLGLAETHAIVMTAPLLATVLAAVVLGEMVGIHRWIAVLLGFTGAVIIIRPGLGVMSWPAIFPVCAACTYAVIQIQARLLGAHDRGETTILYTALVGLPILCVFGTIYWVWPPPEFFWRDLALMVLVGVLAVTAHYLLILAFRHAQASVLQPYTFFLPAWAVVVGYVLFGDFPDGWTMLGAMIVIASVFYVFQRERAAAARAGAKDAP